jgi:competence ComEA-like helix-hairpin-helix protein
MSYSRPQLKLLLLLAATLCVGLGMREWRAGFPDLADRLERFDREHVVATATSGPMARHAEGMPAASPAIGAPSPAGGGPSDARARADAHAPHARPVSAGPDGATSSAEPLMARASPPAPLPVDARPVDINRAGLGELARLPGVGPGMAARIVAERERRGRFDSPDALRAVLGMGPKKLAAIRELITVSE